MSTSKRLVLFTAALSLAACGDNIPPPVPNQEEVCRVASPPDACFGDDVQTLSVFRADGLYTSPSALSSVPEGALLRADNVVVNRPGVYETRHGFERLAGTFPSVAGLKSWVAYGGGVVGWGGGTLARLDTVTGLWSAYPGTYLAPLGARAVAFQESQRNLFFTTDRGVQRLDNLDDAPDPAGALQALEGETEPDGTQGFLPPQAAVAYRFVCGTSDEYGRLILGAPSGRTLAFNANPVDLMGEGESCNTRVIAPLPVGLDSSYFFQAYRSAPSPLNVQPSDEMRQVREVTLTQQMITDRRVEFVDIDPFRSGPLLYTSANGGDGILAARYPPPVSVAMAEWDERLFFAGTFGIKRLTLNFLGVNTPDTLSVGNIISIFSPSTLDNLQLVAGTEENPAAANPVFRVFADSMTTPPTATPTQDLINTVRSLIRVVNAKGQLVRAFYAGSDDLSGQGGVILESLDVGRAPLEVSMNTVVGGIVPAMPAAFTGNAFKDGLTGVVTVTGLPTLLELSAGSVINIYRADSGFTAGRKTVLAYPPPEPGIFSYQDGGPGPDREGTIEFINQANPLLIDAEEHVNGIAYAEEAQPDSVPLTNFETVGNAAQPITSLLALNEALFVLKTDGVWKFTGTFPSAAIEPWDTTLSFVPDVNGVAADGAAYALTTSGLVTWTESSRPRPASIAIEQTLRSLLATALPQVRAYGYMVASDVDNKLFLALPTSAASTYADQIFVLNTLTGAWTRWTHPAASMLFNPADGKLYSTPPNTTENRATQRERKTGTLADYQGPDGEAIQCDVQWNGQTAGQPGVGKIWQVTEFHFANAVPSEITAYYSTDIVPEPMDTPVPGSNGSRPGVLETMPDGEHARAPTLTIGMRHGVAGERMELLGYSQRFRAYGGRR